MIIILNILEVLIWFDNDTTDNIKFIIIIQIEQLALTCDQQVDDNNGNSRERKKRTAILLKQTSIQKYIQFDQFSPHQYLWLFFFKASFQFQYSYSCFWYKLLSLLPFFSLSFFLSFVFFINRSPIDLNNFPRNDTPWIFYIAIKFDKMFYLNMWIFFSMSVCSIWLAFNTGGYSKKINYYFSEVIVWWRERERCFVYIYITRESLKSTESFWCCCLRFYDYLNRTEFKWREESYIWAEVIEWKSCQWMHILIELNNCWPN